MLNTLNLLEFLCLVPRSVRWVDSGTPSQCGNCKFKSLYSPLLIFHTSLAGTGVDRCPTMTPSANVEESDGTKVGSGGSFQLIWGHGSVVPAVLRVG